MHIDKHKPPQVDLGPNGIELDCFLSNCCDEDLDDAMEEWVMSKNEVSISLKFRIADILDWAIFFNEMPARGNAIDETMRPLFETMKAEFAAQIERIDALEFAK